MKKVYLFASTLILGLNLHCQSQNIVQSQDVTQKKSIITLDIVPFTFYTVPRLSLGYLRVINSHISIGGEIGYGSTDLFNEPIFTGLYVKARQYKVFEIATEIMIFTKENRRYRRYISINPSWLKHTDVFSESAYINKDKIGIRYSSAKYLRTKTSVVVNSGIDYSFFDRFGVFTQAGLGARIRSVKFSEVIESDYKLILIIDESAFVREGKKIGLDVNVSIRLYYKI